MRVGAFIAVGCCLSFLRGVCADSGTVLVTGDIPVGVDFSEIDYLNSLGDSSYIVGTEVPIPIKRSRRMLRRILCTGLILVLRTLLGG